MKKILKQLGVMCLAAATACTIMPQQFVTIHAAAEGYTSLGAVTKVEQKDNDVYVTYQGGEQTKITFLKDNALRFDMEPDGSFKEHPDPRDESHVTTIVDKTADEYAKEYQPSVQVIDSDPIIIETAAISLEIDHDDATMKMVNKTNGTVVFEETEPLKYSENGTVQTLKTDEQEYFYGGGQQNGYFSHKGRRIAIENKSTWVDGGVSSPNPFYMSTNGYGVVRHTFAEGTYDFTDDQTITLSHNEARFDAYYFVEDNLKDILGEYTELTGSPILMPKYGFYQGNANCYNKPDSGITLNTTGLDVAQQYLNHDMPAGWFLPNDGYGCGYGSLDNLKEFVDSAKEMNFTTGLWTENDLDKLAQEVSYAGTRMIKTDVRWVGEGYSFGLNGVRQAFEGIEDNSDDRGFVISLDGWAGTQRYASIWSGDQTGGNWEYIRFHIPTYLGAGLSGQPNVGSDLDGIYGGSAEVSTRDFQWKSFTPIMINMSGWSEKDKNPWVWGGDYEQINRMYLKLKAEMLPYYYSYAREGYEDGIPMVRALALEYPDEAFTLTNKTQYEYLWGENLLVAPIYSEADNTAEVRNNIYLPDEQQVWIDYFTGEQYTGGKVINNVSAPLWKLPLFVKSGAIIPMTVENNAVEELTGKEDRIFEVYPDGDSSFELYDDDGRSQEYKDGAYAKTTITSHEADGTAVIRVEPTTGSFTGMETQRGTQFVIHTYEAPEAVSATVGETAAALHEVTSKEAFDQAEGNVYFYDKAPMISKHYEAAGTGAPKLYVKVAAADITADAVSITVNGIKNRVVKEVTDTELPAKADAPEIAEVTSNTITLTFAERDDATADLIIDGTLYENVTSPFVHEALSPDEYHTYQLRYTNTLGSGEASEEVSAKTELDPYRNVIVGATATANSFEDIPGDSYPPQNLVDGDLSSQWYSNWDEVDKYGDDKIIDIDLHQAYTLDKMEYINDGTSQILDHEVLISKDGVHYKLIDQGVWEKQYQNEVDFGGEVARYVRVISHDKRFNSGNEMRIYKEDLTEGFPEADVNSDKMLTKDDLTFLKNYIGVGSDNKKLWNQVKSADFNYNELIDAYDLMFVASRMDGGVVQRESEVDGMIQFVPSQTSVKKGDHFTIDINAVGFSNVYAFNFELLLDSSKFASATCPENVCTNDSPFRQGAFSEQMLDYSKSGMLTKDGNDFVRFYGAFSLAGDVASLQQSGTIATVELVALEDADVTMIENSVEVISSGYTVKDATYHEKEQPDPENPDDPDDGQQGQDGDVQQPDQDQSTGTATGADTGDHTNMFAYSMFLLVSGGALILYRKRSISRNSK